MDNPVTQLDERFSDPGTQPTTWAAAREALEAAQLSWISTVRADGRPHVTPLVAVWLDGAAHFTTGATEQKRVNLAANPSVVLTTGCNTWDTGLDVMVEGMARRVTDRVTLERLAAAWRTKWDGSWQFEVTDEGFRHGPGQALVFAVEPTKVLAFGRHRPPGQPGSTMLPTVAFAHTRHLPPDAPGPSPDIAGHGRLCRLAAVIVAGDSPAARFPPALAPRATSTSAK